MSSDRSKTVYYASIGPELTLYDIDIDGAALIKRGAVTLPANIQYVWPHPSRRYSLRGIEQWRPAGHGRYASRQRADHRSGDGRIAAARRAGGAAVAADPLQRRCRAAQYLLTAYNNPSNVTVHRLNADGTIGAPVAQPEKLDAGIYAHQILATPSNDTVLLVTRGNDAKAGQAGGPRRDQDVRL